MAAHEQTEALRRRLADDERRASVTKRVIMRLRAPDVAAISDTEAARLIAELELRSA